MMQASHHARQAQMLANRVAKNFKALQKWAAQQDIEVFRLYDWDIPEIRAVVDWYGGHLLVAEYARQQTDEMPDWLPTMGKAIAQVLNVPLENLHLRQRRTGQRGQRYGRLDQQNQRLMVRERGLKFWVNLTDYIDTGLYADHRDTRQMLGKDAKDRDFLNLFAYTGAFTVYAAAAGAKSTTTIDSSGLYLQWAKDNLALNGLDGPQHRFERNDVRDYLHLAQRNEKLWDLILLDPPTFSSGEGKDWDVQRDHRALIEQTLGLLRPDGVLYFSTNHQRFEPNLADLAVKECRDISTVTLPRDYRNVNVHRCWRLQK